MHIGILGGTFDPIHLGHLMLARNAQAQFSLDKVLFIPALNPPHKRNVSSLTPGKDRYEMVRLAIKGEAFFEVSDLEIKRKGPSYTYDTVKELEKQYPGAKLSLILGMDAFDHFDTWYKAAELKKRVSFLVAQRGTHEGGKCPESGVSWIEMPLCPITASAIREYAVKGNSDLNGQVSPAVWEYMKTHRLYCVGSEA